MIRSVTVTPRTFIPALGDHVSITTTMRRSSTVVILFLDRDGYVVRTLPPLTCPRTCSATWDGKDDAGAVVPDDAYSFETTAHAGKTRDVYAPIHEAVHDVEARITSYDSQAGTLSYWLAAPARVRIHAGTAQMNATKPGDGVALKTIVSREPRVAGPIIQPWTGRDESGTMDVPRVPSLEMSVAATSLPADAVIATGNRTRTFLVFAETRRGASVKHPATHASHDRGLTALEDVSPELQLLVNDAPPPPPTRVPTVPLRLREKSSDPAPEASRRQRGRRRLLADGTPVHDQVAEDAVATIDLGTKHFEGA